MSIFALFYLAKRISQEDTVKRIVALLLVVAMSAMLFACGGMPTSITTATTAQSTANSSATKNPDVTPAEPVTPYADIDFFDGEIFDNKNKIALELQPMGSLESICIEEKSMKFMGKEKVLSVLSVKAVGAKAKGVFTEITNSTSFDKFVAENGGFSVEVFYLDNSTVGANRGIVCCTESIGGDSKRSGWGIAESASGAPYFITGHTAENIYSSVYAHEASKEEPVHIVGVYNAETKRNAIYVNGSLVSSDSAAGEFTSADKIDVYEGFNMANVFYIGADPSGAGKKAEKCDFPSNNLTVIDVKFYACALTDADVKAAFTKSASVFD